MAFNFPSERKSTLVDDKYVAQITETITITDGRAPSDPKPSKGPSLAAGTGLTFVAQIVMFVLTMGTGILTARLLGPSGKGIYALMIFASTLATYLFGLGIPQFTACYAGKPDYSTGAILRNGYRFSLLGLVLAWSLAAFIWVKPNLLPNNEQAWYVLVVAAVLPFTLISAQTQGCLQGVNRMKAFNLMRMLSPAVNLAMLLAAVLWLNLGLLGALAAWICGEAAVAIGGFLTTTRYLADRGKQTHNLMKASGRFGLSVLLAQTVSILNLRFDLFLVGIFAGAASVGYYSVAASLSVLLWYLPSSIGTALIPRLASAPRLEAATMTAQACRMALAISMLSGVIAALVVTPLIPIVYGPDYSPSVTAFLLLLPGSVIFGVAHITTSYFNSALNRPLISTGLAGLSLTIDIVLNLALTPRWGILGASTAATTSYAISAAVALVVFSRVSGLGLAEVVLIRHEDWSKLQSVSRRMMTRVQSGLVGGLSSAIG